MKPEFEYIIYTDGGSRGNPGEAAYGFVVYDNERNLLYEEGKNLGIQTNNYAEYSGVFMALKWVEQNSNEKSNKISFFLDSQLVTMQLSNKWKIKNEVLRNMYFSIKELEKKLGGNVTYTHVFREQNKEADRMVNMALDGKL